MPQDILCQDYRLMEKEWIKIIVKKKGRVGGGREERQGGRGGKRN